jgi:large subunit ribosomal protein L13
MYKTRASKRSEVNEKWYLVDAAGQRIGRVASLVAQLLLGKNTSMTRDYLLPQNKVVIVNAGKLDITVRKAESKIYTRYSGFPGGLRVKTLGESLAKNPVKPLQHAIIGMLPRNRRGRALASKNLYIYADNVHRHEAQKPEMIKLESFKL